MSRVIVQDGGHGAASSRIDYLIYSREPKGILREVFVDIGIVNAHAPNNFILFSTRRGFASHLGCITFLMNPVDTTRTNLACIASLLSGVKWRRFCLIGLA
jgi:hypothetical protein